MQEFQAIFGQTTLFSHPFKVFSRQQNLQMPVSVLIHGLIANRTKLKQTSTYSPCRCGEFKHTVYLLSLETIRQGLKKLRNSFTRHGREPYTTDFTAGVVINTWPPVHQVNLVMDFDLRDLVGTYLPEYLIDLGTVIIDTLIIGIDNMKQEIGFQGLLQRGTEGRNKIMG